MKNIVKRLFSLLLAIGMVFTFACSNQTNTTAVNENGAEKVYSIGTLQLVQHSALDNANKGFFDYLDEKGMKYNNDQENASGEQSACQTIAQKFMDQNLDLIYAIATPAAQAINAVDESIPVVGCAITDFAESGLCESNDKPNGLITGASDMTPVAEQLDLMMELFPETKTVGILYCSAEANSKIQADIAIEAANKLGIESRVFTVVNTADIQTVTETMVESVDCIYIPTDNTISSSITTVATIANDHKIPTIVGEVGMVDGGCTATYGIDYYELGRVAGEMAYEILVNGSKPADMPIRTLPKSGCVRKINQETKSLFGLE